MGIALDLLVLLFLVWSLVRGWRLGFLYQIGQFAVMIVSYFVARALAGGLDRSVAKALQVSPVVGGVIVFFSAFLLLSLIGGFVVARITRNLIPKDTALSSVNRALGLIVAAAKGALIAYCALVLVIQATRMSPTASAQPFWRSSFTARFVAEHNALDRGEVGAFAKLTWLMATHDPIALATDPRFQRVLASPRAAVLTTPEFLGAIGNQDYVAIMRNDALWEFLKDADVQAALQEFPWVE